MVILWRSHLHFSALQWCEHSKKWKQGDPKLGTLNFGCLSVNNMCKGDTVTMLGSSCEPLHAAWPSGEQTWGPCVLRWLGCSAGRGERMDWDWEHCLLTWVYRSEEKWPEARKHLEKGAYGSVCMYQGHCHSPLQEHSSVITKKGPKPARCDLGSRSKVTCFILLKSHSASVSVNHMYSPVNTNPFSFQSYWDTVTPVKSFSPIIVFTSNSILVA